MRRSTFIAFLVAAALIMTLTGLVRVKPVAAQAAQAGASPIAPTFTSVEVDLWPEYDQPSMLVVLHLILDPATALPASLTLHIPSTAGDPYNLASRQSDGQLYNMAYTRTVEGNFSRVDFTTTTAEIQFEYYDPGLNKAPGDTSPYPILKRGKSQRAYTYEWQGDYAVKSMAIQVQQPLGASQMTITPSLGTGVPGEGGMLYYNGQVGAVTASTKFKIFLTYQKPDDSLSAAALKVQPSSPITPQTPGRAFNLTDYLPWILGGAGILLAAGGGLWYWRSTREENRTFAVQPVAVRSKPGKVKESAAADEGIYCHQCGKLASGGDIFCRSCGTRLRRE